MDDYMSKPISPELLEDKIRRWLGDAALQSERSSQLSLLDAAEHLAFAGKALTSFDRKSGCLQIAAHEAGGGIGGEGAAGDCLVVDELHQFRRPHVAVARRGEAVEIPGVEAGLLGCDAVDRRAADDAERRLGVERRA